MALMMMGDENDGDEDDDRLVCPINTSSLQWIVLSSVLPVKIHSVVLSWPASAASAWCRRDNWATRAVRQIVLLCSGAGHMCTPSFHLYTDSSQVQLQIQVVHHHTSIAHVPPVAHLILPGPPFWAALLRLIHCCTNDLNNTNKWRQILVIPLCYLTLTPSLSAPGATVESYPLGSLRSGTVRP